MKVQKEATFALERFWNAEKLPRKIVIPVVWLFVEVQKQENNE